jgi:hypothetical protein
VTQTPPIAGPATKQANVLSIVSFVLSALAVSIVATILGFALDYLVFANS